ncbi:hypothetical protein DPMN_129604, partial [Dreissena polymorpha]
MSSSRTAILLNRHGIALRTQFTPPIRDGNSTKQSAVSEYRGFYLGPGHIGKEILSKTIINSKSELRIGKPVSPGKKLKDAFGPYANYASFQQDQALSH